MHSLDRCIYRADSTSLQKMHEFQNDNVFCFRADVTFSGLHIFHIQIVLLLVQNDSCQKYIAKYGYFKIYLKMQINFQKNQFKWLYFHILQFSIIASLKIYNNTFCSFEYFRKIILSSSVFM